jgi:hypothetical protein
MSGAEPGAARPRAADGSGFDLDSGPSPERAPSPCGHRRRTGAVSRNRARVRRRTQTGVRQRGNPVDGALSVCVIRDFVSVSSATLRLTAARSRATVDAVAPGTPVGVEDQPEQRSRPCPPSRGVGCLLVVPALRARRRSRSRGPGWRRLQPGGERWPVNPSSCQGLEVVVLRAWDGCADPRCQDSERFLGLRCLLRGPGLRTRGVVSAVLLVLVHGLVGVVEDEGGVFAGSAMRVPMLTRRAGWCRRRAWVGEP